MKCQFCKQDVDNPCHNMQEMQQRASSHIMRCEKALKSIRPDAGAHQRDIQGRH